MTRTQARDAQAILQTQGKIAVAIPLSGAAWDVVIIVRGNDAPVMPRKAA
jgi:hypothetical protein